MEDDLVQLAKLAHLDAIMKNQRDFEELVEYPAFSDENLLGAVESQLSGL